MMEDMVLLEIYRNDELIQSKTLDLYSWYDGEVEEIDNSEFRVLKGITKIIGKQYGEAGQLEKRFCNYYDSVGKLIKFEEFEAETKITKIEEFKYDSEGCLQVVPESRKLT